MAILEAFKEKKCRHLYIFIFSRRLQHSLIIILFVFSKWRGKYVLFPVRNLILGSVNILNALLLFLKYMHAYLNKAQPKLSIQPCPEHSITD